MEDDLPRYIELIDSSSDSEELILDIYEIVKEWLLNPYWYYHVCDTVLEKYGVLCTLETRLATAEAWQELYNDFKSLKAAIQNGSVERSLNSSQRRANQQLIDSILFYIRLFIVALSGHGQPPTFLHGALRDN